MFIPSVTRDRQTPRGESVLHVSSPDLFLAINRNRGAAGASSEADQVDQRTPGITRPQALRQHIYDPSTVRRSWHFDDKNGAYTVTNLITDMSPESDRSKTQGFKPPVPPRRDKVTSDVTASRGSLKKPSPPEAEETTDLMLLDDMSSPVKSTPNSKPAEQTTTTTQVDINPFIKKNTNPFISDDTQAYGKQNTPGYVKQDDSLSRSWDSQPWPDPPSFIELPGEDDPSGSSISGSTARESPSVLGGDDVPESLQYQPQNTTSAKPTANKNSRHSKSHNERSEIPKPTAGYHYVHDTSSKPIPPVKEYDNPMFMAQNANSGRDIERESDFTREICDSTSFVHPLPNKPPYPHSGVVHNYPPPDYRPRSNEPNSVHKQYQHQLPQRLVHNDNQIYISSSSSNGSTRSYQEDRSRSSRPSSFREKTSSTDNRPQKHGRSRPRQVKRENTARRGGGDKQTTWVPQGYYSSNPDLSSKSPTLDRRRRGESLKRDDVRNGRSSQFELDDQRSNHSSAYHTDPHKHSTAVYSNVQTRCWGDSDL